MGAIEDVILRHDRRGINRVARYLPEAYCLDAARFALDHPGRVLIDTGFFVLHAGSGETDGPMGAVVLAHALRALGNDVQYVTDGPNADVLRGLEDGTTEVVDFPWGERDASRAAAAAERPSTVAAAGGGAAGVRPGREVPELPGHGHNPGHVQARLPLRRVPHKHRNRRWRQRDRHGWPGPRAGLGGSYPYPALTKTAKTIVASTSLWDVYGLVAGLSMLTDRDLLPTAQMQEHWLRRCVELNAAAVTGRREATVDSHSLAECTAVLDDLRKTVGAGLASGSRSSRR